MNQWAYGGVAVIVPSTADIPGEYKYLSGLGSIIQKVLDRVEPWEYGESPIEEYDLKEDLGLDDRLKAFTVPNMGATPFWAVHASHKAKTPGLSPFVYVTSLTLTRTLTIELGGKPSAPVLTRAYPGKYRPPLPWQSSAADADGGMKACVEYWSNNSYIYNDKIVLGIRTYEPPAWFLK